MDHPFATPTPSTNGADAVDHVGGTRPAPAPWDDPVDDDPSRSPVVDDPPRPLVGAELADDLAGQGVSAVPDGSDEPGGPDEPDEPDGPGLEVELDTLAAVEAELADVELALVRLDDGSYGRCEVCDGAIDDGRLAEAPAARFCRAHLPIALA